MLFAVSLIFVFLLLGLMIYKSEFFHATSDDVFNYEDDFTETEHHNKKYFLKTKILEKGLESLN